MYSEDLFLIQNFHSIAGHSRNSVKAYNSVFNKYSDFHKMSLTDLLKEAIDEQERNIPLNKLKLFDRLNSFKQFLIENHKGNTISSSLVKIKTFYKYNRVNVPFIPPVNHISIKQNDFISYNDLLTKSEIRNALNYCCDDLKIAVLIMISSGLARDEAKRLTNNSLYEGTYEYHQKEDIEDAFCYLSEKDNAVCCLKLIRQKTNKPYYAFLNPETVQLIAKTKIIQEDFKSYSPLIKFSVNYINYKCKQINDSLNLGYAGGYSRFRPHMFRKFNSTHLNQGSLDKKLLLDMETIDNLQGRGKNSTRESYFKDNPEFLKLSYIKCMSNVSIYHKYTWEIVDGEVIIYSEKQ